MPYLAPIDLLEKIQNIREKYSSLSGVTNLDTETSYIEQTVYGKTDTKTRTLQLNLLKKLVMIENPLNLKSEALANIHRYRFMVGILLCIQLHIEESYTCNLTGEYGKLHTLITEILNINEKNEMDIRSKALCLKAVSDVVLISLNEQLDDKHQICDGLFLDLQSIARRKIPKIESKNDYPISHALARVGEISLQAPGYAIGWVLFDTLGKSGLTASIKFALTGAISYIFCLVSPIVGAGTGGAVLFFSRQSAERAVNITCGITGAMIVGDLGRRLGRALGGTAGFGLDLAYKGTCQLVENIQALRALEEENLHLSFGVDVIENRIVVRDNNGLEIDLEQLLKQTIDSDSENIKAPMKDDDAPNVVSLKDEEIQMIENFITILEQQSKKPKETASEKKASALEIEETTSNALELS